MSGAVDPALEARGLGYRVQRKALVDGIDVSFERGDFAAVVGPNGSGKTTLLRLLAGVLKPSAGEVRLMGRELSSIPRPHVACLLSYVPQNTWTEFEITVFDAVAMGRLPSRGAWRGLREEDYAAVNDALARVDLTELSARTLPTLSGGERQRVFVARALAQGAGVLVLDEPTSSLDIGHQLELMEILRELNREGKTVVAAMHDLDRVLETIPRVVLLDRGRVTKDGPSAEVLESAEARSAFGVNLRVTDDGQLRAVRE